MPINVVPDPVQHVAVAKHVNLAPPCTAGQQPWGQLERCNRLLNRPGMLNPLFDFIQVLLHSAANTLSA